jgi:protein kinase A
VNFLPFFLQLNKVGYLKIVDFGFSKKIPFKSYTLCGTPEYMAPEVILSQGHGKGVDWWGFGVLCYEMLVGQPPWVDGTGDSGNDGLMGIYHQILEGKVLFPKWVDGEAKSLVKRLLTRDLTRRLGCLKVPVQCATRLKRFTHSIHSSNDAGRCFRCQGTLLVHVIDVVVPA